MRKIIFRAKLKDKNKWIYWNVYGELCSANGKRTRLAIQKQYGESYYDFIWQVTHLIIKESIGQYTGITHKNIKIFEGDIVKFKRVNALGYTTSRVGEVQYYGELPIFYIYANTGDAWDWVDCEEIEVIGNIHDNPELMERECD